MQGYKISGIIEKANMVLTRKIKNPCPWDLVWHLARLLYLKTTLVSIRIILFIANDDVIQHCDIQ